MLKVYWETQGMILGLFLLSLSLSLTEWERTKEHHHMGVPIMKEANETMAEDLVEPHKCRTRL
jgi:hypothetical protein